MQRWPMKVKGFCRKPRPENPLGNTEYSLKAYFYLLPAALILAVFVFFPIIMTLRMGFYESYVYLTDVGKGFGLASFRYVLKDPAFRSAVRNTLIITFIGVPITIVLSLGSALFINSLGKGKGLFQTIYFLPYVTSTIAIGLVFRWLFHSDYGYINHVLSFFGLPPQKWLTDPNLTTIPSRSLRSGTEWPLRSFCFWQDFKRSILSIIRRHAWTKLRLPVCFSESPCLFYPLPSGW